MTGRSKGGRMTVSKKGGREERNDMEKADERKGSILQGGRR